MFKYYLTLAAISIFFIHQPIAACPCSASSSDKRPFFEQYEPDSNSSLPQKITTEQTNPQTEIENS